MANKPSYAESHIASVRLFLRRIINLVVRDFRLCLLALLLISAGCQSLNPTREQQLQSFDQKKTKPESDEGRMVTQAGSLLNLVLPFLSN